MKHGTRLAVLAGAWMAVCAVAQEGFPLDGTWRGEWIGPDGKLEAVVILMQWDGETIQGTINPGRNAVPFTAAELNVDDWSVRIEAAGAPSGPISIEGRLRDIGSYRRFIEGAWTTNGVAHGFKIARE